MQNTELVNRAAEDFMKKCFPNHTADQMTELKACLWAMSMASYDAGIKSVIEQCEQTLIARAQSVPEMAMFFQKDAARRKAERN